MDDLARSTGAAEVLAILDWLEEKSAVYQVNGGWATDALVGSQTRPHRDLDLFIDDALLADLLGWLRRRGYSTGEDWLPVRIELESRFGRVDVHPMAIQPNGDGIQQGLGEEVFVHRAADRTTGQIAGRDVVVATARRLLQLRQGYQPSAVDIHDIALLESL